MCKPAPLRCAGLHNLLPVIWCLYFNKLTKLNIQFLIKQYSDSKSFSFIFSRKVQIIIIYMEKMYKSKSENFQPCSQA